MGVEAIREPGRREPAPEPLRLVQAFVNTRDIEAGTDELTDPEALKTWLRRQGLPGAEEAPTPGDLERVVAVREALRALALANNGEPLDPRVVEVLNGAAQRARLAVRFDGRGRGELVPVDRGVDGAIARILAAVVRAMTEDTWSRVKACRNHACGWVFYDRSRNRSGTWCTMAVCGNLMKARAYRARRAGGRT